MEASLKSDDELMQWFRDRLVWGDPGVVTDLLKKGLFARLYEPQVGGWLCGRADFGAVAEQRVLLVDGLRAGGCREVAAWLLLASGQWTQGRCSADDLVKICSNALAVLVCSFLRQWVGRWVQAGRHLTQQLVEGGGTQKRPL